MRLIPSNAVFHAEHRRPRPIRTAIAGNPIGDLSGQPESAWLALADCISIASELHLDERSYRTCRAVRARLEAELDSERCTAPSRVRTPPLYVPHGALIDSGVL